MSSVAESLKATLIDKQGLTVTALAPMLGIARPSLSKVLNGRAALSPELAIRIETVFGISARTLLVRQLEQQLAALDRNK